MKKSGFTLIELLIVVAIIAILAAIAVPNFLEAQVRSKVARTKADMRSITTALEAYRIDSNGYPPSADWKVGETMDYWSSSAAAFHSRLCNFLTTPIAYASSLPEDVFKQNMTPWSSTRYPVSSRVGHRYVYFNYYQFTSAASLVRRSLTGGWLFYSFGPDNSDNQTQTPNGTWLRYDPSNGTVSPGNIVRTQKSSEGYIAGDAALTGAPMGPN